jgi:hypothetical protein
MASLFYLKGWRPALTAQRILHVHVQCDSMEVWTAGAAEALEGGEAGQAKAEAVEAVAEGGTGRNAVDTSDGHAVTSAFCSPISAMCMESGEGNAFSLAIVLRRRAWEGVQDPYQVCACSATCHPLIGLHHAFTLKFIPFYTHLLSSLLRLLCAVRLPPFHLLPMHRYIILPMTAYTPSPARLHLPSHTHSPLAPTVVTCGNS